MTTKIYLLLVVVLSMLSGCIKVEDGLIKCNDAPDAPVLSAYSFTKNNGESLQVPITNYNVANTYTVALPTGEVINLGSSYPVEVPVFANAAGTYTYKLYAGKNLCASEATEFTVTISGTLAGCGLSPDNFLFGSNPYTTNEESGYSGSDYYYIQWNLFEPGSIYSSRTFTLYFKQRPPTTGTTFYSLTNAESYALGNNTCRAQYYYSSGSTNYVSSSGAMAVTYASGVYTVTFCNASLREAAYNINVTSKGVLTFVD
ncbi:MAG: hypothetical protein KA149_10025 [Chitinophagales bacterium]|nr:hypothetical protein [Chitinophagales bacterium]